MRSFFKELLMVSVLLLLLSAAVQTPASGRFKAPEFKLPTLAGEQVALEQYKEQSPVLLVFWATWCPGCIREVQNINDLVDRYRSEGLVTIGVNVGESAGRVERFKEKYKPAYTLALDKGNRVSRSYMIQGVPTLLVINKQGNITYAAYQVDKELQEAVEVALQG